MKTMTCKQLGGACDLEFHANTLEEMAEMSKKHGMDMYQNGDEAHIKAMDIMREKTDDPIAMTVWYEGIQREFDALPEDK